MKIEGIVVFVCMFGLGWMRRHRKKKQVTDPFEMTAVQEMNIRARGTFVLNYIDQFDRVGYWNQSDPDINGAPNREEEEEFLPDKKKMMKK